MEFDPEWWIGDSGDPFQKSSQCWVRMGGNGFIGIILDEEVAQTLATMRPDNIYFKAEMVME